MNIDKIGAFLFGAALGLFGVILIAKVATWGDPKPVVKPGTITKVYQKGYEDGMYYVSGYWSRSIKDCFYKGEDYE